MNMFVEAVTSLVEFSHSVSHVRFVSKIEVVVNYELKVMFQ